jgi:hypothetical protein
MKGVSGDQRSRIVKLFRVILKEFYDDQPCLLAGKLSRKTRWKILIEPRPKAEPRKKTRCPSLANPREECVLNVARLKDLHSRDSIVVGPAGGRQGARDRRDNCFRRLQLFALAPRNPLPFGKPRRGMLA